MPSILNLKFKGNKSFVAFSNLADTDTLTSTWKVCTKVASYLEQGQRLENLSWRLWHLQNLMVDTDNAKSKREFKKLSKCMGDKLDKEKGRSIEELEAPDFKRNHSTDLLRQRAAEKERSREASQNAKPGTIKRMQFTFSIDAPMPASWNAPVTKPDLKPSTEFKGNSNKRARASIRPTGIDNDSVIAVDTVDNHDMDQPLTKRGLKPTPPTTIVTDDSTFDPRTASLLFPSLFSTDFNPSALLYPTPSVTNRMSYGEGIGTASSDGFSITRPTIELPLDDILNGVDTSDGSDIWSSPFTGNHVEIHQNNYIDSLSHSEPVPQVEMQQDVVMHQIPDQNEFSSFSQDESDESEDDADDESYVSTPVFNMVPPPSQSAREHLSITSSFIRSSTPRARTKTPIGRPSLTVKTDALSKRVSALGATPNLNQALLRQGGETANNNPPPTGGKAECSNCGATHTPLWRRGLNDELNCNACGLYCKLHKRPRPKSMRNTHSEGRTQSAPRQETVDVMARTAQCYNCHTTATPLWRKDDEGKTVCNACGLYYKLHGSSRPISMKSDVIRKRSRHEARRGSGSGTGSSETPSVSRGSSPVTTPDLERSPTLAPDSTTQMSYDYCDDSEFRTSRSELMGALGNTVPGNYSGTHNTFPGPYHPDYLSQQSNATPADALPFACADNIDGDAKEEEEEEETRTSKRRRMSTDSASEPPSSAVSFSSYNDGYSSQSPATSHSQRSSMDFPFNNYQPYTILRGSGNTFWHPPMSAAQDSPQAVHPPMLPAEDLPMDYPHPPMLPQEEETLFSQYLHPPVIPADESTKALMNSLQSHSMFHNDMVYTCNGTLRSDFYDTTMHSY